MKLTHEGLCAAIVILGGERFAKSEIREEELNYLVKIGLADFEDGDWWLTDEGEKLVVPLVNGDEIEPLI